MLYIIHKIISVTLPVCQGKQNIGLSKTCATIKDIIGMSEECALLLSMQAGGSVHLKQKKNSPQPLSLLVFNFLPEGIQQYADKGEIFKSCLTVLKLCINLLRDWGRLLQVTLQKHTPKISTHVKGGCALGRDDLI